MHLCILQIDSTSAPAAKQVLPVTLVHCHTTNSTYHANHLIHQVIDIINHVKLSATHAHLLNRTIPSFTHPEKVTVIFSPRQALLSLRSLTATLALASSALATSWLASYSLLCLLSHLAAEYFGKQVVRERRGPRVVSDTDEWCRGGVVV